MTATLTTSASTPHNGRALFNSKAGIGVPNTKGGPAASIMRLFLRPLNAVRPMGGPCGVPSGTPVPFCAGTPTRTVLPALIGVRGWDFQPTKGGHYHG
jgi:hypothetical protein